MTEKHGSRFTAHAPFYGRCAFITKIPTPPESSHANYLRFMERARTEWLRAAGFDQTDLAERHGVAFVVRSVTLDYLKPARFNDTLQVTVELIKVGAGHIELAQRVMRHDELLATGTVKVACVGLTTFRVMRIPQPLATKIRTRD